MKTKFLAAVLPNRKNTNSNQIWPLA